MPDRVLRYPEVCTRTGLARTTIEEMVARGAFLRPRQITVRAVAWLESELDAWIRSRPVAGSKAESSKGGL